MQDAVTQATEGPETSVLPLPSELTIYTVGELYPAWRAWVEAGGHRVDGRAVDQLDGSGLQLLLSLARSTQARGVAMTLSAPSRVLSDGCAALGLTHWLAEHLEGASA